MGSGFLRHGGEKMRRLNDVHAARVNGCRVAARVTVSQPMALRDGTMSRAWAPQKYLKAIYRGGRIKLKLQRASGQPTAANGSLDQIDPQFMP